MATSFRCTVVTPAAAIFDEPIAYASLPAWDGQMGVMGGRSPLVTRLGIGPMRLDLPGGTKRWFMIDGGFAEMSGDALVILTERAIGAEEIDSPAAQSELAEANAHAIEGGIDRTAAEAAQARARTKIRLAGRR